MRSWRTPGRLGWLLIAVALLAATFAAGPVGADTMKAPVGVWSGVADSGPDDYHMLVIDNGPAGSQPGFLAEAICGPCNAGPCGGFGTASFDDQTDQILVDIGELVCFDTGNVVFDGAVFEYDYDAADDVVSLGDAVVYELTRKCGSGETTHEGTGGNDRIVGTAGNDIIDGKGGNDTLIGKGGWDILCGSGGKDKLKGGTGVDILLGGPGNDKGFGGAGWDVLIGSSGKDALKGQAGTDFLIGGAKKDRLIGGGGPNDYADGGGGADICNAEIEVNC